MSGSETGVMSSANIGVPRAPPGMQQPLIHNMGLSYNPDGTALYKPLSGGSPTYQQQASGNGGHAAGEPTISVMSMSGNMNMNMNMNMNFAEPVKKKRGRPRKYGPDGSIALSLSSTQSPAAAAAAALDSPGVFSPSPLAPPSQSAAPFPPHPIFGGVNGDRDVLASPPSMGIKKPRGRPPGSSKKNQFATFGSVAIGFTPHVITVKAGEDVSSKVMSFSQNGPRAVCILSANGAISNVTLRQAATSGGTVTYEGRFEILSLSGSFMLSETGGQRSRTGGLSVSLAGPDGRVLGGGVAGLLTAASPVQVVVGSFIPEGQKQQPRPANPMEAMSAARKMVPGSGTTSGGSPPSRGTLSESSGGGSGSPLNQEYRSL